jgi:hypothetical protein
MKAWGIAITKGRALWGMNHGHLRWLPYGWRKRIISAWNNVACGLIGHDKTAYGIARIVHKMDVTCLHCCKVFDTISPDEFIADDWEDEA